MMSSARVSKSNNHLGSSCAILSPLQLQTVGATSIGISLGVQVRQMLRCLQPRQYLDAIMVTADGAAIARHRGILVVA